MINPESALEIDQLLSDYVYIIDDADWARLEDILTEDVIFDFTQFGLAYMNGRQTVITKFQTMTHPIAHHAVNTLVKVQLDEYHLRSKMIIAMGNGKTWYGEYRDIVVRSSTGLRFRSRTGVRPRAILSVRPKEFPTESPIER